MSKNNDWYFNDYISTAIGQHFQKRKAIHTGNFLCNKWFDDECKEAKRILHDKGKTINTKAERVNEKIQGFDCNGKFLAVIKSMFRNATSCVKWGGHLGEIYASRNRVRHVIGPDIAATVLFKVFDTQIQQIIDYGSEVCYNGKSNRRLESLHLSYLKRALGVKLQTSNLAALILRVMTKITLAS